MHAGNNVVHNVHRGRKDWGGRQSVQKGVIEDLNHRFKATCQILYRTNWHFWKTIPFPGEMSWSQRRKGNSVQSSTLRAR